MSQRMLHRVAVLVAACTFVLVIIGGLVSTYEAGLSVPDWPLSFGKLMPAMEGGVRYEHTHRLVAALVGLLTILLCLLLYRSNLPVYLRRLGLVAVLVVVFQGVLGGLTVLFMLPKAISILHATTAHLFFTLMFLIAVFTSASWLSSFQYLESDDQSLGRWAWITAGAVLLQVVLGAAYRHHALGIMWHIGWAAVVTGLLWVVALQVLSRHPEHELLRKLSLSLVGISLLQLFLGIGAYAARALSENQTISAPVLGLFTVAHVAMGSLTLALTVLFAVTTWRALRMNLPLQSIQQTVAVK